MRDPLQLGGFTEVVTLNDSVIPFPLSAYDRISTQYEDFLGGKASRLFRGEALSGVSLVLDLAQVEIITEVTAAEIARLDDLAEKRKAQEKLEG